MYTVGEMAQMLHVPASTLRYYDKQGLLPFVERSPGGIRIFKESDFEWLRIIECMKKAGMSLKDIRTYIELAMQGNTTINERLAMFRRQQDALRAQMQQLQDTMQVLEYKCWYYETAQKLGSVDAVKKLPIEKIPAEMQAVKAQLCDCPENEKASLV
ncbi:MerR family transcriptional regulator [uncultured Gemmiger sp.]|uniref:MerR family transcriptional regulator n=1 Tax=uncultured Gemmiger sp. TaxID=1623490 RepID=UPI0025E3CEC5|nr:MerR family transcriptional regulator [uncultured Gemmiger sp.]